MPIKSFFENFFPFLKEELSSFSFTSLLDILLLSVLFLGIYQFLHDRRAANLLAGLLVLFIAWAIVSFLDMNATAYLLDRVFDVGIIALIVIFRDEIRTVLEKVGDRPWRGLRRLGDDKNVEETFALISAVCDAVGDMRKVDPKTGESTGALIVLARKTPLDDITSTGDMIDASVHRRLIVNLFFKNSPLHDGAVVISGNRIAAARCTLPITERTDIPATYGMRHKAAIGITEASDADVIVVSEETGKISFVKGGAVTLIQNINELKLLLGASMEEE
jgi:uncharacterized protein (TIGR00159 family)